MTLIVILLIVVCLCMKFTQCVIFNAHNIIIYSVRDLWDYFRYKKWRNFSCYGIDMYIGMFGKGKTLSMVHTARRLYKKYGDKIVFLANFELKDIPCIPLVNFNQLLDIAENPREDVEGYVIMVDEIQSLLSHRDYAKFPLELIGVLTQQRKLHMYFMCTAQRFFMVDKIWRSITTNVIDCNKFWRFEHNSYYDAWDYENAMNASLIRRQFHDWWFVKNCDYNAYDTSQMISKNAASDFISNEEAIVRKGLDSTVNELAVKNHARSRKKALKK